MATINAASASYAHVAAAIALASANDTVTVPAGSATWTDNLVITVGINLIGNGIGSTVITGNYNAIDTDIFNENNYLISYIPATPASNDAFRLSGFTIDPDNKCRAIYIYNSSTTAQTKIRIDHTDISNSLKPLLHLYGTIYGVADSNDWSFLGLRINGLDDVAWTNYTYTYGSANNFYLEDNVMECLEGDCFYLEMGSRFCLRYNTLDSSSNAAGYYPLFNFHGDQAGIHSSLMGAEVYENDFTGGTRTMQMSSRGGKVLFYNNEFTTTGGSWYLMREEEDDALSPPATSPDGQPQHVSSTYLFGNTKSSVSLAGDADFPYISGTLDYGGATGVVPRANVHFWAQPSSFDGTVGVGVGLLAARPATCTTGVGYWGTDTEILYRAVATNTWEAYYTPYTYPHPLRAEGVAPDVMTVTSPNGGESWAGNSEHNITWTNTGDTVYANVKIQYSADSGVTWTNISASTANTGSYSWTVPNSAAATYMIKVSAVV
jgi:hypothetical protein